MIGLHHIPGEINPADILSKHWGYSQIWSQLQAILFWRGNTGDLLPKSSDQREGSDKFPIGTSP